MASMMLGSTATVLRQKYFRWVLSAFLACFCGIVFAKAPPAGIVWMINGAASRSPDSVSSNASPLKLGDEVVVGDTVATDANSEVMLMLLDKTTLIVRPNTRVTLRNVKIQPESETTIWLDLIMGGLRTVTGIVGKVNPKGYRIKSPTASIGIRGTDHETYVIDESNETPSNLSGTYDKVNSGETILVADGKYLSLQKGQVGFAHGPMRRNITPKSVATMLYPVLLEKIPDFFQHSTLDSALDEESSSSLSESDGFCKSGAIARKWLGSFDAVITHKDASALKLLISADANIVAYSSPDSDNNSSKVHLSTKDFIQTAHRSFNGLSQFSQQRLRIYTQNLSSNGACDKLQIISNVRESSVNAGLAYTTETKETFTIKYISGRWVAQDIVLRPVHTKR